MSIQRESGLRRQGPVGLRRPSGYRGLPPVWPARPGGGGGTAFGGQPGTLRHRLLAKDSPLRQLDWVLLAVVLGLSLIGTLLVWSSTQPGLRQAGADPQTYLKKQLLNIVIGLIVMGAVTFLDARQLRLFALPVYALSLLGLVAVLTPLGSTINGAHAWISLPAGFQVEPAEYAKLGLILTIAMIFSELRDGDRLPRPRDLVLACAAALPVLGLVVAEPALGMTIVILAVTVGMIALSGIRLRWLAALGVAGVGGVALMVSMHLLKPFQVQRLTSFANPAADPLGAGYNAAQAKIAVGSGGMFGQGLFHGGLVTGRFIPSQSTDFIFTVAGEELGFVGCITIIVLLGVLLLRTLRIAATADDQFGLLAAAGVGIWFAVQSFINIGMTIGIMPVTGIPLPFVSYGGSAMFADMIAIGLLQSVHRRHYVFS
ncbi:MAG: rod shape-determining protein RodA [Actinobacteria bacterium]|nr:rod shape-determining protein RodA [Actinomycetota bacterium]